MVDRRTANQRARKHKEFWTMVYTGQGISYTELKTMIIEEYTEAVEAKVLFNNDWRRGQ